MRPFEYHAPRSMEQALELLARHDGQARLLAGGTDLLVRIKRGQWRPRAVIDLRHVPGLRGVERCPGGLWIGALSTMNDLVRSAPIARHAPVLARAAAGVAGVQVRNLATVGGNLCNASPAADLAPPLLALDARIEIAGPAGRRRLPLSEFFRGPGQTVLQPVELVTGIELAEQPGLRAAYRKVEQRQAMDIAIASVAVALTGNGRARIALGAVAPVPLRARGAEALLGDRPLGAERIEAVARAAAEECRPIDDLRASAWYRRRMVRVLTARLLRELDA